MPSYTRNSADGAPLVLVHGVGGDASNWDAVVERLPPRFRVIRPDLGGHGRSRPITAPCSAEDLARGVMEGMDAAGVPAASVAGFSLGGTVALALALLAPARVQRLALIGTPIGRTPEERAKAVARSEALQEAWMQSFQLLGNEPEQLRTLQGVSQWQVYFYFGNAWSNCGSSADVAAPPPPAGGTPTASPAKQSLPDGVRMVVTFADGGTLAGTVTRDIRLAP